MDPEAEKNSLFKNEGVEKVRKVDIPHGSFVVETENSVYNFDKCQKDGIRSFCTDSCALIRRKKCKIITLVVGKPMVLEYYPPIKNPNEARRTTTNVVSIKVL